MFGNSTAGFEKAANNYFGAMTAKLIIVLTFLLVTKKYLNLNVHTSFFWGCVVDTLTPSILC